MQWQRLLPFRANPSFLLSRPRQSAAWALGVTLFVGACDSGSENGETSSDDATSSPTDGNPTSGNETGAATSTATAGSDGADGASDDGPPPPSNGCNDPQEVPAAPVDCSGADGVIDTSVIIEPGQDDPSILMNVRRVEGSIRISRLDATDLSFMACVQEVTGDVTIFGNDQLTNVDGLWSLTSIGTDFVFSENDAITNFDGLPNLVTIPRNLVMKNNLGLQSVSGFHQLEEVGDNLLIQQNDVLGDVNGLGGLRTVGGVFGVTANPQLCISSVNCVGVGITDPATPPDSWSTQANDFGC